MKRHKSGNSCNRRDFSHQGKISERYRSSNSKLQSKLERSYHAREKFLESLRSKTKIDLSLLQLRDNRYMVGRGIPASRFFNHLRAFKPLRERGGHPDVIKPATFIGGCPVFRTIAPPAIKLCGFWREITVRIHPASAVLQGG